MRRVRICGAEEPIADVPRQLFSSLTEKAGIFVMVYC